MEPIWMDGQDMIEFEKSQGESRYFYKNYQIVNVNPHYKYLVGLDEMEKHSIVYKIIKEGDYNEANLDEWSRHD